MTTIPIDTIRASATPLAFRCAGSARRASLPIAEASGPADLGNATHEALRPLAEGRGVRWDELPTVAGQWGVDADDLRMLVATANKLWPQIAESFRDALTEVELSTEIAPGIALTGHVDLLSVAGAVARAGDWKSGRKDYDYGHQMRAYGALILADDPDLAEVTITVIWIRHGEIENYTMDRAAARAWLDELRARVVEWDGVYRPGPHCGFCPRSHECEALAALVRRDVSALLTVQDAESALAAMPPAKKLELYRKASMVVRYAERVRAAIKADVEEHGDVVTPDGRLTIVEEPRREIDPLAAWPVLEGAGFKDRDFAEVMDLSVTRVEKLVAKRAGRGKGAAAVRDLAEKLSGAGAVKIRAVRKLQEGR